jgi:ectoine hydroxylase-related dioxygenase (phytanoyl-CoA dioxygenase family)
MITQGVPFSIEMYRSEGYSGPVQGLTLEEAEKGYDAFFHTIGQSKYEPGPSQVHLAGFHYKHRWAYDLATHESIVGPISQILGPNVLLWAMNFWYKEPGNEKFIPWHQDYHYWPMEPAINATAWVTLGYSLEENGCLQVIPGTHTQYIEHVATDEQASRFQDRLDDSQYDISKAVPIEMTAGQICFFNERTVHGSNPNFSNIPRVAFSLRFTVPEVQFAQETKDKYKDIRMYLVKGEDNYRYNEDLKGIIPEK